MYAEQKKFYADRVAVAEAELAQAANPEDGWETLYCAEERWCVAEEVRCAKIRLAKAIAEYDENEEGIAWEIAQKEDDCCQYDICWCNEDEDY
jgi:hypothetical protein